MDDDGVARAEMEQDLEGQDPAPATDEVLRELIEQHGPSVYRMARSIVRDAALAEDVTQETFIKAWQNAETYRGTAPIRHWLLRISHNVAVSTLRVLREDAHDPASFPERYAPSPEGAVEARSLIDDALTQLDPTSRAVVVLRELEGLSYAEISEVLDLPMPTVKTRLFRARATLRTLAGEGGP